MLWLTSTSKQNPSKTFQMFKCINLLYNRPFKDIKAEDSKGISKLISQRQSDNVMAKHDSLQIII